MTPTIVTDGDGNLRLVLGSPGGATIITTLAQVSSHVIDDGLSVAEAIASPRIHHQALPDHIYVERGGLSAAVIRQLEAMGHSVEVRSGYSGEVTAIAVERGRLVGVADPRRGGGAAGN